MCPYGNSHIHEDVKCLGVGNSYGIKRVNCVTSAEHVLKGFSPVLKSKLFFSEYVIFFLQSSKLSSMGSPHTLSMSTGQALLFIPPGLSCWLLQ